MFTNCGPYGHLTGNSHVNVFSDRACFKFSVITFAFGLGFSCDSFKAAASIELAARNSSFSAITVGSSGSTQSEPIKYLHQLQITSFLQGLLWKLFHENNTQISTYYTVKLALTVNMNVYIFGSNHGIQE